MMDGSVFNPAELGVSLLGQCIIFTNSCEKSELPSPPLFELIKLSIGGKTYTDLEIV